MSQRPRVVVTGASRGIGQTVVEHLARAGMDVVLIARDKARLEEVRDGLAPGDHRCFAFDVTSERAWNDVASFIAPDGHLTGVVTAAGMLGPIGSIGSWPVDDFRKTIDVNVIGTLLAVTTNAEALRQSGGSVVTFSGGGATTPLTRFDAYATSKAAVVRLTENLAIDLKPSGVRINSVAPGFVVTDIHQATLAAGPENVGAEYFEKTRRTLEAGDGDSPELAASLVTFLLSPAASGITGKLLSARWDPWGEPEFQRRLRDEPDLATLRRIDDQFFSALPSAGTENSGPPSSVRS